MSNVYNNRKGSWSLWLLYHPSYWYVSTNNCVVHSGFFIHTDDKTKSRMWGVVSHKKIFAKISFVNFNNSIALTIYWFQPQLHRNRNNVYSRFDLIFGNFVKTKSCIFVSHSPCVSLCISYYWYPMILHFCVPEFEYDVYGSFIIRPCNWVPWVK